MLRVLQSLLTGELGFDVWGTCDGNDWYAVTRDAFSGDGYNFGGRTLQPGGPNGDTLYIGSANQAQGTTIFQDTDPLCSSGINTSGSVASPAALMTDAAAAGHAADLEARRARHQLSGAPVVVHPGHLDVQGAAGAAQRVPLRGRLADSDQPGDPRRYQLTIDLPRQLPADGNDDQHLLRRSFAGHHAYEVVAKNGDGRASNPSNLEVVPDPRPAATFGAIQQALGEPTAVAAGVGSGAALGPPGEAANAAESAWRAGHRAAALADLSAPEPPRATTTDLALTARGWSATSSTRTWRAGYEADPPAQGMAGQTVRCDPGCA